MTDRSDECSVIKLQHTSDDYLIHYDFEKIASLEIYDASIPIVYLLWQHLLFLYGKTKILCQTWVKGLTLSKQPV